HQVIRKVTKSMQDDLHFNTSIAAIMEFLNLAGDLTPDAARTLVQLLAPMTPFMAETLWEGLGGSGSIFRSGWPEFDPELAREDEIEVVVQVNGKVRARFPAPAGSTESELRDRALQEAAVRQALAGQEPRKVIVAHGRLVNVVV